MYIITIQTLVIRLFIESTQKTFSFMDSLKSVSLLLSLVVSIGFCLLEYALFGCVRCILLWCFISFRLGFLFILVI